MATARRSMSSGPIRAKQRPTSLPSPSTTLSCIVPLSPVICLLILVLVLIDAGLCVFRLGPLPHFSGEGAADAHDAVVAGKRHPLARTAFGQQHFLAVLLVARLRR